MKPENKVVHLADQHQFFFFGFNIYYLFREMCEVIYMCFYIYLSIYVYAYKYMSYIQSKTIKTVYLPCNYIEADKIG